MIVALVVEIVAAVAALALLVVMIVNAVGAHRARAAGTPRAVDRAGHMKLSIALLAAAAVHGCAAMVYDSGAIAATYVCGWIAFLIMVAAGIVMLPAVRKGLGARAVRLHRALPVLALVFFVAHIVCGRI